MEELNDRSTQIVNQVLNQIVTLAVVAVYAALVAAAILRHEPWGDEQTAWILAKNNSLWHLATTVLRHEGSPGLWHGLLWLCGRMGLSFTSARLLFGMVPVVGAYVVVRWAPLPLWLRALLPFSFFLLYQYAVVARQYIFFPVLVFGLAAIAGSRVWRPYLFAILACLLANVSAHGFCCVLGLCPALYLLRHRLPSAASKTHRTPAGAIALIALGMAVAVATAMPIHRHVKDAAPVAATAGSPVTLLQPLDIAWLHVPPDGMNGLQTTIWQHTMLRDRHAEHSTLQSKALHGIVILLSLLTFPIASSNLLAFAFLGLTLAWLWQRRALILLLPYALIFLTLLGTQAFEHHTGLLFVALVGALWTSFELTPVGSGKLRPWLLTVFGIVVVLQVSWGLRAVAADLREPYTGDEAAVRYLETVYLSRTVALGVDADEHNTPFFTHTFESPAITAAVGPRHPDASDEQQIEDFARRLALHPQMIVEAEMHTGDQSVKNQITPMTRVDGSERSLASRRLILASGYRETHRFCGRNFMRAGYSRELCTVIYEPAP